MEKIEILIRFSDKEMTASEYIIFSKSILSELNHFANDFKTLYAWGSEASAGAHLKEDLSDFESVVFKQLKDDKIAYSNPDKSSKEFTLNSKCFRGYSNSYSTNKDFTQDQITVTISAGKENSNDGGIGILNFEFSKSLQAKLNFSNLIKLLEFSITLVNPYYATISSFEFRKKANQKDDNFKIGWINYFRDKQTALYLPIDVSKEILHSGGIIFWLSEEKVVSTNETLVAKAIEIRNILAKKGLPKIIK